MLYHDTTYYICRSRQIAAHRAGERSDAGRLGSGSMFVEAVHRAYLAIAALRKPLPVLCCADLSRRAI